MEEEHAALIDNNTWELVPRPAKANVVTGKWIFKHKFHADGSLDRYKARWVLRGFTQRPGIDYDETFSPVVKPATVRTVITIAHSRDWPIHQLDVKNAFLHGTLSETVYCSQPTGFTDPAAPNHVCKLNKSLYGLKQAPRAWYSRFASFLLSLGFTEAKSDTSLFIYRQGAATIYLLLYVDDIVLTASSSLLQRVIDALKKEFAMKDLDSLQHFLGVAVQRQKDTMFLSQRQYILDILARHGMSGCKPCSTPVDTCAKISADAGPPWKTLLPTAALRVHFSTSHSLAPTSPMRFSKSAYTCIILGRLILLQPSGSSAIFKAPSTTALSSLALPPLSTWSTPTPTGSAILTPSGVHLRLRCLPR
jgi:hypothetical protein